jgi:hypothetical protein
LGEASEANLNALFSNAIERDVEAVLAQYASAKGVERGAPIPIEDIVEKLKLRVWMDCTGCSTSRATCVSAQAQQQGGGSAAQIMSSIPTNSETITHWYKQSVYDPQDNKIGEIMDVLVTRDGKVTALIIGVGGFLGIGEKGVAVPFNAVQVTNKNNNKWYLVMNATKDALKNAKGFKYDRCEMKWAPEESSATTGSPSQRNR